MTTNVPAATTSPCPRCGASVPRARTGRPRVWCSDRCRRLAHAAREDAAIGASPVRVVRVEPSADDLDAAVELVLSSPGASRRVVATLRRRWLAGELDRGPWFAVTDLLGASARR